jgi:hypothetical protein
VTFAQAINRAAERSASRVRGADPEAC